MAYQKKKKNSMLRIANAVIYTSQREDDLKSIGQKIQIQCNTTNDMLVQIPYMQDQKEYGTLELGGHFEKRKTKPF